MSDLLLQSNKFLSLMHDSGWALCGHDAPPGTAGQEASESTPDESVQTSVCSKPQPLKNKCDSLHGCTPDTLQNKPRMDDQHSPQVQAAAPVIMSSCEVDESEPPCSNLCETKAFTDILDSNKPEPQSSSHSRDSLTSPSDYRYPKPCTESHSRAGQNPSPAPSSTDGSGDPVADSQVVKGVHLGSQIPMSRRVQIGVKGKRLIDKGRLDFLRASGLKVGLCSCEHSAPLLFVKRWE